MKVLNLRVILRVFQKIYLIGFANNISKERQYKDYCLISNDHDSWKCALDYCNLSNNLDLQLYNDIELYNFTRIKNIKYHSKYMTERT